jgi:hypothetical protein
MATEVTKIVDPGEGAGHDYHSLSLWEAGEQKDLVTADQIAIAKCRATGGTADTTACTIDGWTTDSTRYIKIWTDPSESYRHSGKWDTGKYRLVLSDSNNRCILISGAGYVRVDGIQLSHTNAAYSGGGGILIESFGDIKISNNIIKNISSTSNYAGTGIGITAGAAIDIKNIYIWNNVIYDFKNSGSSQGYAFNSSLWGGSSGQIYIYNNTIVDNVIGISDNIGLNISKNNIVKGSGDTNAYVGTFAAGTDYNATDGTDTTGQGAHSRISQTFTFVDEANDDFHLASNDVGARNYGTDLSGDSYLPFSNDIDGQTRPGEGIWDIGADEYVAAGGLSIPVAMANYRQRWN